MVQNNFVKFIHDPCPFFFYVCLHPGTNLLCLCWRVSSSIWPSVALNHKSSFSLFANSYHNLNIGFATKCGTSAHEAKRVCLGVKQILTNRGECKGWSLMTSKCTRTLGVAFMQELWMFGTLVGKENKH